MNSPDNIRKTPFPDTSAPFDAVARDYDRDFTDTSLGRRKRQIVREYLAGELRSDWRVLELNCGTGEDALWLSERVREVVATDISEEMIRVAREKCDRAGRTNVRFRRMGIEELWDRDSNDEMKEGFDLIFSNFDGLNCLRDLTPLPEAVRTALAPGGSAIFVFMPRFCAVEMLGFGIRGRFARAFARLRREGLPVHIGGGVSMTTYFPSTGRLLRLFRNAGLRPIAVRAVGLLTPPTSMRGFYHRRISFFRKFEGIEEILSSHFPFSHMGDHVLIHLRRES